MARAGRKRNSVTTRQPNGRANAWEDPQAVVRAKRIRDKLWRDASHEWFGWPLGIMFADKTISEEEYGAAKTWAAITWRYNQIKGIAMPFSKAIDWGGQVGRALKAEPDAKEIERVKAAKTTQDQIIMRVHPKALAVMMAVCICDESTDYPNVLIAALKALVESRQVPKAAA